MPQHFSRRRPFFCLTFCALSLVSGSSTALGRDGDAPASFTPEQIYAALVEPALAVHGRLSSQTQKAILATARKMLDEHQVRELERRMKPYCVVTTRTAPLPRIVDITPPILAAVHRQQSDLAAVVSRAGGAMSQEEGPAMQPGPNPSVDSLPNPDDLFNLDESSPEPKQLQPNTTPDAAKVLTLPTPATSGSAKPVSDAWCPGALERCREPERLCDNLSVYAGLDGSKGPEDLGINANMGMRAAVNWGIPVWERMGLGVQIGTAINYHNNAVTVLEAVGGPSQRTQSFTTLGIFQRTDFGLKWGVAWDYLHEDYWANFNLSQFRGQVGYSFNDNNEVGVWGTLRCGQSNASFLGTEYQLRTINQANLFWRHVWPNEAATRVWVGVADQHDQFVLVLPGLANMHTPFIYGADVYIPLNHRFAIFGEANFITPANTGIVTATFGLMVNLGGKAVEATRNRFAPLLPVANNPTFAVDLMPK